MRGSKWLVESSPRQRACCRRGRPGPRTGPRWPARTPAFGCSTKRSADGKGRALPRQSCKQPSAAASEPRRARQALRTGAPPPGAPPRWFLTSACCAPSGAGVGAAQKRRQQSAPRHRLEPPEGAWTRARQPWGPRGAPAQPPPAPPASAPWLAARGPLPGPAYSPAFPVSRIFDRTCSMKGHSCGQPEVTPKPSPMP